MIDMISSLIEKEKAYESEGDVFYSVSSFDGYGQLSGKKVEDLQVGARVEVNEQKHDALDFVRSLPPVHQLVDLLPSFRKVDHTHRKNSPNKKRPLPTHKLFPFLSMRKSYRSFP
jgi:hypothetical protein